MPRSNVTLLGASASDEPEIFDQVKCGAGEAQPPATQRPLGDLLCRGVARGWGRQLSSSAVASRRSTSPITASPLRREVRVFSKHQRKNLNAS